MKDKGLDAVPDPETEGGKTVLEISAENAEAAKEELTKELAECADRINTFNIENESLETL